MGMADCVGLATGFAGAGFAGTGLSGFAGTGLSGFAGAGPGLAGAGFAGVGLGSSPSSPPPRRVEINHPMPPRISTAHTAAPNKTGSARRFLVGAAAESGSEADSGMSGGRSGGVVPEGAGGGASSGTEGGGAASVSTCGVSSGGVPVGFSLSREDASSA